MFVAAFQNGLKAWQFNDSVTQKSTLTLVEVVTRVKCYIKDKESNAKNKSHDVKDHVSSIDGSHPQRKNNYASSIKDNTMFKRLGNTKKSCTPLNTRREQIWSKVFHMYNILTPSTLKAGVMGLEPGKWCKFRRFKEHHIEDFYHI